MVFHEGERAVQERAGRAAQADKLGRGIHEEIPDVFQPFLREQRLIIAGAADGGGRLWATALYGPRGFVQARDPHTLAIAARPLAGDALADAWRPGTAVGLLAIELATRRRVRLNGTLASVDGEGSLLRMREVFGNCPRYIQTRALPADGAAPAGGSSARRTAELDAAQRDWIAGADTFFIASAHPTRGADASHRGGTAGFVQLRDARTLRWPDYAGNGMFQTLGNLAAHPEAGLLFIDFAAGAVLQLNGTARVSWDAADAAALRGAERVVEFTVAAVVERRAVLPAGWRLLEASPHNP
jgi:predicted pyridoxine 5'-phosphate oxidase superfamily flavin-nucleotide-binding protein